MTQFAAKGTLIAKGDGASPEVFNDIAQVNAIGGPDMSAEMLDVTTHSSTGGKKEFVAGLVDNGEVTLGLKADLQDSTQSPNAGLINDLDVGAKNNYRITFVDGTIATFAALVSNVNSDAPVESDWTLAATIKISGVITWS